MSTDASVRVVCSSELVLYTGYCSTYIAGSDCEGAEVGPVLSMVEGELQVNCKMNNV